jgi:hypothetical protein
VTRVRQGDFPSSSVDRLCLRRRRSICGGQPLPAYTLSAA